MTEIDELDGFAGRRGPYTINEQPTWPFDIGVADRDGTGFLEEGRYAYSSSMKTLADVMDGAGFDFDQRDEVIGANARQMATLHLLAKSYELALLAQEIANTELFPTSDTKGSEAAARFTVLKRKARSLLSDITESKT